MLGAVIIIVAVAGAVFYIAHTYRPAPFKEPAADQTGSGNAAVGATGTSAIVTYSDTGFSPSSLSIGVGTTVTWANQSSHTMWVQKAGSAGDCSSAQAKTLLNECQAVSVGGTYSYTFTTLGTFSYFNQEKSTDTGTVVVSDASAAGPINPSAVPE